LLIRSGEEISDSWLLIGDAAPTLVGVMAFVFALPYELSYTAAMKARHRGCTCRRADFERQGEEVVDSSNASKKWEDEITL
jgi:hypothetical protein